MEETNYSENFKKLLSLSKEELEKIFSEFSLSEIEDLLDVLKEVKENDEE